MSRAKGLEEGILSCYEADAEIVLFQCGIITTLLDLGLSSVDLGVTSVICGVTNLVNERPV